MTWGFAHFQLIGDRHNWKSFRILLDRVKVAWICVMRKRAAWGQTSRILEPILIT